MDTEKNDVVHVNHSRLMTDLSKDFAADIISKIHEQLIGFVEASPRLDENAKAKPSSNGEVTVYY